MKKNLIFKLCFIVGSFLIILTACDLGTKQWANLTFSLEGPTLEGRATQEGRSSSSRYIHPDANYLIFELFSGNTSLSKTTQSITDGKDISIRLEKVPLNDPNLRAEIKVWRNGPTQGADLLGQNSIHLGRIGLGYTKLTLGVKPVEKDLKTATYESGDNGTNLTYTAGDTSKVWKIQMHPEKGLYTISDYNSANIYLYDSDGKNYQNSFFIDDVYGQKTRVFYHPEDKASTYYAYFESQEWGGLPEELGGRKLEQEILVTQKSNNSSSILGNSDNVDFNKIPSNDSTKTLSFTIYNPYSSELKLRATIGNETGKDETGSPISDSTGKFKTNNFPASLPPGGSQKFDIIFDPKENGDFSADFTIQTVGLDDFVLELSGSGSGL